MQHHRLERTGEPDLVFEGELIAESDGERAAGKAQDRWHNLWLYRTAGGHYVVHVAYRTRCAGELDYSWAQFVEDREFAIVLQSYESAINVPGFSGRSQLTVRQATILISLRRRYGAQAAQVLREAAGLDQRTDKGSTSL